METIQEKGKTGIQREFDDTLAGGSFPPNSSLAG
jgi:hypothetical protein